MIPALLLLWSLLGGGAPTPPPAGPACEGGHARPATALRDDGSTPADPGSRPGDGDAADKLEREEDVEAGDLAIARPLITTRPGSLPLALQTPPGPSHPSPWGRSPRLRC